MWERLLGPDFRRRRLLGRTPPGPLHDYLATPFPDRSEDFRAVEFVALDLETTGLDPRRDEILSVGLVSLRGQRIALATACHWLVTPTRAVPESSAVIHQITDDHAAEHGRPLAEVMPLVLERLAGRVLLGHHVRIEREFLDAACRQLYGSRFLVLQADTEALIGRWLKHRNQPVADRGLRLHAQRERFGLPRYKAHNALVDALATAELFCAFAANRNLGDKAPLRMFLESP
jgi:DNA polymerase-3 subunit epsilon